eukprot:4631875-Alexandrium_andersonii.AAC.1
MNSASLPECTRATAASASPRGSPLGAQCEMPSARSWAIGGRGTTFCASSIGRRRQRHHGWSSSS